MPRYAVRPEYGPPTEITFARVTEGAQEKVFIGRLSEAGSLRNVFMDTSAEMVLGIFGKRGSGKSYTLGVIAEGMCTSARDTDIGVCSGRKAVLLMDTLNVFWSTENPFSSPEDALRFPAEMQSLKSWRLAPPALKVTVWVPNGYRSAHTPRHYKDLSIPLHELTDDDIADLFDIDSHGDLLGQLFSELREKAAAINTNFTFLDMLAVAEDDEEVQQYYAESTRRAARQRLRWASQLAVFQNVNGVSLRELLKAGHLSILELGELPNSLRTVIASVLLRRIHAERAKASGVEKQLTLNTRLDEQEKRVMRQALETATPPTWVMIDEAQNILPSERTVKSTDAIVRFVREGRNFGLSFAFTTQQPAAVDQRILAQADTIICHKLTVAGDIQRFRDNLKSAEPADVRAGGQTIDLDSWIRSLDRGQAVVSNTDAERLFAIELRPRVCPHGGTGFQAVV